MCPFMFERTSPLRSGSFDAVPIMFLHSFGDNAKNVVMLSSCMNFYYSSHIWSPRSGLN